MYSDTLFFNQINTLFIMKTLKLFILLTGLFTLIQANLNAQIGPLTTQGPVAPPVIVNMTEASGITTNAMGTSSISVSVECNMPRELAIAAYTVPRAINNPQLILTSQNATRNYTEQFNFDGFENDEVYVECGYIDDDGNYVSDSGCTVVIWPK